MSYIISNLQRKVNKIISDAGSPTSFINMVDLNSVVRVDTSRLVFDILEYLGMLGVKGLTKHEDSVKVLIGIVSWKLYLFWYKRCGQFRLFRSRVSKVLRKIGMVEQADNFDKCGQLVYNMECTQCGYVHAVRYHCKLRVCPQCGWVRKGELTAAYADALQSLGRLRFMTLTIKNVSDLKLGIKRIRKLFGKLRHDKIRRPVGWIEERRDILDCDIVEGNYYKGRIRGGLYGIEPPVGLDGLWHVHLHILFAGSYIPQDQLSWDWLFLTGDSRVVYIQDVKRGQSPIGYILKYVNKHDSIVLSGNDKLAEYVSVLYNVRLLQPFGCLLGVKAEKPLFLCPECGGCVWKIVELDTVVGFNTERRYCKHSDHEEYLATMYKR